MRRCPKCRNKFEDSLSMCPSCGITLEFESVFDAQTGEVVRQGAVLGSYKVIELLGEGGMGRVYLAEHTKLGRKVALKLLHPEYAQNPKAVRRFFSEARAVNQIGHPNIVEITDFVEEGREKYYIMELLNGQSLTEVQLRIGVLPLGRSIPIVLQVCSALSAAHARGIIHRDIKPDNVFLIERDGRHDYVKLIDFGVAKLPGTIEGQSMNETSAGAILGTPEYMSPEQASGTPIDHRSDIYSLGIMLYELVCGRKPFTAKSFGEMVVKHLTVPPSPPSQHTGLPHEIPARIEETILHCLEKDPTKRPQQMAEVGERLQATLGNEIQPEQPVGHATMTRMRPGRGSRKVGLIAGASALSIAVAGLLVWRLAFTAPPPAPVIAVPIQTPVLPTTPVATEVHITIDSEPKGAQVYRDGDTAVLGTTPFTLTSRREEQKQKFTLKLSGYRDGAAEVAMTADNRVVVPLVKAKLGRKTKGRGRADLDRGGVLDPFADD